MTAQRCRTFFGYTLLCLLPAVIVFIIVGAIYLDAFNFYEVKSHNGFLIDTYVSTNAGETTTYVVEQVFSYAATTNGHESSANCSRDARSYYSEDQAIRSADSVVLGTTRTIYLSKSLGDHSCIDRDTREFFLQVGLYSMAFVAAYVLAASYLVFVEDCRACCVRRSAPAIFVNNRYQRTGGAAERDADSVITDFDDEAEYGDMGIAHSRAAAPERPERAVEMVAAGVAVDKLGASGSGGGGAGGSGDTRSVGSWASTADALSDEDEGEAEEEEEDGDHGVQYV
jgi:hypothetical protein